MPAWRSVRVRPDRPISVVFLHGFLGSARDWVPVVERLGLGALIYDLPGHGATSLSEPPSLDGWARSLAAQLRGADPVVLVGYSLGGRLALRVAANHPDRVRALALIGANPGLVDSVEREERARLDDRRADAIRNDFGRFLRQWYAAELFALTPAAAAEMVSLRSANDPAAVADVIAGVSPGRARASWDALERLSVPLLVGAGERDEKYVRLVDRVVAVAPVATGTTVPDAGHAAHVEQPEAVARVLSNWISRLD